MSTVLELKGIQRIYHKGESTVRALAGVDLVFERGEFTAVTGPSGSGKTTLLNIIGCLDTPTAGLVIYNGEVLGDMNENALSDYRKEHVSFVFQSYNLIPVLTVRENVELPLVIERKLGKGEIRKRALEIIEAVGLSGKEDRYPRELSGGQEQRVAIARALVKEPTVVLADEPTANLDSATAAEVIEIMRTINRERNATFLFSTHDPRMEEHARRIITIHDGKVSGDRRREG